MDLLGPRIKQLRIAAGLTQAEAAEACDLTATMFSRFENGKGDPALSTLRKLAHGLGFSLGAIFADHPTPPPPPPRPRKPTPAEVAVYLFEKGAPEVDKKAIAIIRRTLEADAAELAVLFENIEELFSGDLLDKTQSS